MPKPQWFAAVFWEELINPFVTADSDTALPSQWVLYYPFLKQSNWVRSAHSFLFPVWHKLTNHIRKLHQESFQCSPTNDIYECGSKASFPHPHHYAWTDAHSREFKHTAWMFSWHMLTVLSTRRASAQSWQPASLISSAPSGASEPSAAATPS